VSVVIPAYRRPDMVERALRSVLAQRRPPDEVIVVDDASGDDTAERAAALGARVIVHEDNRGEGGARNSGIDAARNGWVALLDCDDEWLPDHLETLWEERDGHAIVGAAAITTSSDPDDHYVYGSGRRMVVDRPERVAVPENMLLPSAVMVRRDALLEAGGFRALPRAADLDMWLRMLERGTAIAIPRVTVLYHVHAGQVSTDQALMDDAHRAVLDDYTGRPWCTPELLRRHEGIVAWDAVRAARRNGAALVPCVVRLARRLAHPQRALGVAQLLAGRFTKRRLGCRVARGGVASVAVLPGCPVDPERVPGAVDLRSRAAVGAWLHLARRPTARAYVRGPLGATVARALGIEPLDARRADAA
jgi:hypothetical protein